MVKQKCVRTYELYCGKSNYATEDNCKELNDFLNEGWKVVMVTPKSDYNEYIIEKEVENETN